MTVIGFLSVAPVREGSMAEEVAKAVAALEDVPVSYETTPMGTVIEADDIGDLLDAVEAAHRAVDADRVSTFLKVDHKRGVDQRPEEKVADVEEVLGREARGERDAKYTGRQKS
ncbi:MAG: MTH1187 family thiamine-binding protein [Halobacteriales archaeon]